MSVVRRYGDVKSTAYFNDYIGEGEIYVKLKWVSAACLACALGLLAGCSESEQEKQFRQELLEKALNDEVKQAGEAFLAENRLRSGVQVTETGLQYEIIRPGSGKQPALLDRVRVNYRGWLISGDEFESSVERDNKPVFPVNGVVDGWREALMMMSEGAVWKIYLPSELAYGAKSPTVLIPANSALIFEIELLEIVPDQEG